MAERVVKVRLTAQIAEYREAMRQASEDTKNFGTEAQKLQQKRETFRELGQAAVVVGAAMVALTFNVAKVGIAYNTLQQTSRAALNTLLGGTQAANAQMDKLDAFARTSPFSKAVFIQAQQQMLAFGIETEKVIPYLDAMQEAVAATGGNSQTIAEIASIMSKISSASKITAEDLNQFADRGVDAASLIGSQMGFTAQQIREQITAGTLDAGAALDALAAGMKQKFDGASANVKDTYVGALDRVGAAWRDLSADLMRPLVDPDGGGILVDLMNGLADFLRFIQGLPEPVKLASGTLFAFVGLVALVGGTAILAVPKLAAFKDAMVRLNLGMGTVAKTGGILVAALTVLVSVLSAVGAAQAAAKERAEGYAAALEQGSDAVRTHAVEVLQAGRSWLWFDQGNYADRFERVGVSISTVTDAFTGNSKAMAEVRAQLQEIIDAGPVMGDMDANVRLREAKELLKVLDEEAASLQDGTRLLGQKNEALGENADASAEAADGAETAASAYLEQSDAVSELTKDLDAMVALLNEANGVNQSAISANASYVESLAGIAEEMTSQRDAYEEANGSLEGFVATLDQSTVAGAANADMLANVAGKAQDAAAKQYEVDKATMSAKDATDKYVATLTQQRQKFEEAAVAAGFSADEVKALADQVFALPDEQEIKILAETSAASNAINKVISDNNGRRITLNVVTNEVRVQTPGGMTATSNFTGNLYDQGKVQAFYKGGFPSGIYAGRPGGIHKLAEPETGWETYISGHPGYRDRNIGIWMETGRRLGALGAGSSGPTVTVTNGDFYGYDPDEAARLQQERLTRALDAAGIR